MNFFTNLKIVGLGHEFSMSVSTRPTSYSSNSLLVVVLRSCYLFPLVVFSIKATMMRVSFPRACDTVCSSACVISARRVTVRDHASFLVGWFVRYARCDFSELTNPIFMKFGTDVQ